MMEQDYTLIAGIVKDCLETVESKVRSDSEELRPGVRFVLESLMRELKRDNCWFDPMKFITACEPKSFEERNAC